ncbi:MAG: hypothetical protein KME35_03625 [Aphanocapsa sp. GSE-SYN-MK-11-07L]|jgi:hypothetical protein|nr:hypothetical protein [Aphanocapsa sp. GSE-SYN-MK-11-07L]
MTGVNQKLIKSNAESESQNLKITGLTGFYFYHIQGFVEFALDRLGRKTAG